MSELYFAPDLKEEAGLFGLCPVCLLGGLCLKGCLYNQHGYRRFVVKTLISRTSMSRVHCGAPSHVTEKTVLK